MSAFTECDEGGSFKEQEVEGSEGRSGKCYRQAHLRVLPQHPHLPLDGKAQVSRISRQERRTDGEVVVDGWEVSQARHQQVPKPI